MTTFKKLAKSRMFSTAMALVAILLFNLILNPNFFSIEIKDAHLYGSIIDIIKNSAPIMIIALGMTLVIATGGTDLSVGAVVALAGAISVSLIRGNTEVLNDSSAMALPLVIIITLVVALLCGMWNGLLVAYGGIQPIVATLILMVAGRGIAQLITGARNLTTSFVPFSTIGQGWLFGLPFQMFIALAMILLVYFATKKTAFGMFIQSVGINASASRYSGINSKVIILSAYGISGLCAGVAGLIVASNIMCADANNAGLNFELDAILAVVLGGTSMSGGKFSLLGSALGALIIQSLTTSIYLFNVPPEITLVVKAIVVIVVVLMQSKVTHKMMSRGGKKAVGGAK